MSATTGAAPVRTRRAPTIERRTSLTRGPALIVGTVLLAAGLYFMYRQHTFTPFGNVPSGRAPVLHHAFFGIFGVNGWTGMFTAVAGGLLLFGAAEHYMSKAMSLFVGACLAAAAIIAVVSGDVVGLIAANGWTEVGWGAAAVILFIGAFMPARRRVVEVAPAPVAAAPATAPGATAPAATPADGLPADPAREGQAVPAAGEPGTREFERTHRITGGPQRPPAEEAAPATTTGAADANAPAATVNEPVAAQEDLAAREDPAAYTHGRGRGY